MRAIVLSWLAATLTTACSDFEAPADLDRPQFAAIQADPPAIVPGGRARMSALLLGPQGEIAPDAVEWAVVPATTGGVPMGMIVIEGDGTVFFQAPPSVAGPTAAAVELRARVSGELLVGVKVVLIGAPIPIQNPVIDTVSVDGVAVGGAGPVTVDRGSTVNIAATQSPTEEDAGGFSWYSNIGDIERDRDASTSREVAMDGLSQGWLFVVARNGLGGISWRSVAANVN
jgi:hypothetical protein